MPAYTLMCTYVLTDLPTILRSAPGRLPVAAPERACEWLACLAAAQGRLAAHLEARGILQGHRPRGRRRRCAGIQYEQMGAILRALIILSRYQ